MARSNAGTGRRRPRVAISVALVVLAIASVVIAGPRLDPNRWVGRIAPRPFVMVNAAGDERLPCADVEALYASAREPNELEWLPGAHVRADTAVVRSLAELVLARVRVGERRGRRALPRDANELGGTNETRLLREEKCRA